MRSCKLTNSDIYYFRQQSPKKCFLLGSIPDDGPRLKVALKMEKVLPCKDNKDDGGSKSLSSLFIQLGYIGHCEMLVAYLVIIEARLVNGMYQH